MTDCDPKNVYYEFSSTIEVLWSSLSPDTDTCGRGCYVQRYPLLSAWLFLTIRAQLYGISVLINMNKSYPVEFFYWKVLLSSILLKELLFAG